MAVQGNKVSMTYRPPGLTDGENEVNVDPSFAPAVTAMQPSGNLTVALEAELPEYLRQFQTEWDPFLKTGEGEAAHDIAMVYKPDLLAGGKDPFLKADQIRGRKYILVDEWGPYDFRSPLLWPRRAFVKEGNVSYDAQGRELREGQVLEQHFEVLGPKGTWRLGTARGVSSVSANSGTVPGKFVARMESGKASDVYIELVWTNAERKDYLVPLKSNLIKAGQTVRIGPEKQPGFTIAAPTGKDRITLLACEASLLADEKDFPAGELFKGQDAARVVHPFYVGWYDPKAPRKPDPARMVKKTIEIDIVK